MRNPSNEKKILVRILNIVSLGNCYVMKKAISDFRLILFITILLSKRSIEDVSKASILFD